VFALLSVLAALTSANAPPVQACGRAVHRLATAPPAALIVRTGCGSFEIEADGTILPHQESWAPPWAPGATSSPGPGVYVAHPHRHLVVLREGRTLWRSQLRHGSDGVVVHGSTIAFSVYTRGVLRPSLWMAQVGHAEFLVARSEEPIGWAAGGLLTQHGDDVRVRRADGSLGRTFLHDGSGQTEIKRETYRKCSHAAGRQEKTVRAREEKESHRHEDRGRRHEFQAKFPGHTEQSDRTKQRSDGRDAH